MAVVSAGLGYLGAKKQASAASEAAALQTQFAYDAQELAGVEADKGFRQTRQAINQGYREENRLARQGGKAVGAEIDAAEAAAIQPMQEYADAGSAANAAQMYELGIGERPDDYAGFEGSTGYQFARDQGIGSIDASAASRGGLQSGATMKALAGYTTGLAQQDYGNHYARLGGVAQRGQDAAGQISDLRRLSGGARVSNTGGVYANQTAAAQRRTNGLVGAVNNRANVKTQAGVGALNTAGTAQAQGALAAGQAWSNGAASAAQGVNNTLRLAGQYF